MISNENIEKLSKQYQMGVFPNIIREYFQHVFLSDLYKIPEGGKFLLKGGTALRIVYGSPRFSEDLDFSLFNIAQNEIKVFVENCFLKVLAEIERSGIKVEVGKKSNVTSGGYFGVATFETQGFQPVDIEINISTRNDKSVPGEVVSIANDFVPTYNIIHFPQEKLVEEKIFGALVERKKPRDFYDLYFMMRRGMLSLEQKKKLSDIKSDILAWARKIDFKLELGALLPADQQDIVRDFIRALETEIGRQVA